jgi:hypothetical protein
MVAVNQETHTHTLSLTISQRNKDNNKLTKEVVALIAIIGSLSN